MVHSRNTYLKTLGDDAGLVALASGEVQVQCVDKPGPEVQHIPLLLYGEALVAAAHHCLHELVRAHLHHHSAPLTSPLYNLDRLFSGLLECFSSVALCFGLFAHMQV